MDLSDAVETYVAGREARGELTAGSARELRCRLRQLVEVAGPGFQLEELDRATVAAWQATIGAHRPATRRAYLSTVRTFCRWAVVEGLIPLDPTLAAARIREPRRATRALPASTVARLRLVLPDLRAEVIVALMFHMGLRCVEVARLRTDDYDQEAAVVVVRGKNDDERRLPVPGPIVQLLAQWAAAGGSGRDTIVGLSANRISKLVSEWMNAAGLKSGAYDGVSAHALRHTMASNMLERCGNVRTVQDALGHISLATTERYLRHANLDELRAAMDPDARPHAEIASNPGDFRTGDSMSDTGEIPTSDCITLPIRLRAARIGAEMSEAQMAWACQVDEATIVAWEEVRSVYLPNDEPEPAMVARWAAAAHCDLDWLTRGDQFGRWWKG